MLDDLIQTIDTLKERIRKHKDYLGAYEVRTRVALIDPMLRALGWDVDDPGLVRIESVESEVDKSRVDYALLGSNGRPVIFIEAKNLAENVDDHTYQTLTYTAKVNVKSTTKIPYCACTNGDDWEVFDVFTQNPVMRVSVTRDDSAKAAMKFLALWRRSFSDGSFDSAIEPLPGLAFPETAASSVAVAPSAASDSAAPSVTTSRARRSSRASRSTSVATQLPTTGWTSLTGAFKPTGNPPPLAIRLPDGNEIPLKIWRDLLIETALWLYRLSLLTRERCPISLGGKSNLFSLDGLHTNGNRFRIAVKIGDTGIIMEGNHNAKSMVTLTQKLLLHYRQDPSKVLLRLP